MSPGAWIAVGAAIGLVIGILLSIATDLPLAPEAALLVGALAGWFLGRSRTGSRT